MRSLRDIIDTVPKTNYLGTPRTIDERNIWNTVAWISARANLDFSFFAESVLGIKMSAFHKEIIPFLTNSRFIMIVWPRGHLKTTILSEAYVMWRLWREKDKEIAITSSALEQSQKTIENIQYKLADNEFLKELIPTDRNMTWNKSSLETINHNKCYQKPFNSTARGIHVDYLILDDILREENLSQEQIKDFFWSIFYPTVQTRAGQMVMIGTPMTTRDLMADILNQDNSNWKSIKRSCVYVDEQGKWKSPLWPERFALEELADIKEKMGSLRFEREYMCNPLGAGANIFKNIKIGTHSEINKALPDEQYFIGCDIAMMSGTRNDFLVITILGKNMRTGMVKQRKLERYKGFNQDEIIGRLKELTKIFNPLKIVIENVGISAGLVKDLQNKAKYPEMGKLIEPYFTGGRVSDKSTSKKEQLVNAINVGFDTGILEILDNTIQYNELVTFKAKEDSRSGKITYESVGEHDDTVIALGLAMWGILEEENAGASISII